MREKDRIYVKNGLNPVAGLTQAHYIKGYFLLHHLLQLSGDQDKFFDLVREYILTYFGKLVNSTHFIEMFYSQFPNVSESSKDKLIQTWLHSPGIPGELTALNILDSQKNCLYSEVSEAYKDIHVACRVQKKKSCELVLEEFRKVAII